MFTFNAFGNGNPPPNAAGGAGGGVLGTASPAVLAGTSTGFSFASNTAPVFGNSGIANSNSSSSTSLASNLNPHHNHINSGLAVPLAATPVFGGAGVSNNSSVHSIGILSHGGAAAVSAGTAPAAAATARGGSSGTQPPPPPPPAYAAATPAAAVPVFGGDRTFDSSTSPLNDSNNASANTSLNNSFFGHSNNKSALSAPNHSRNQQGQPHGAQKGSAVFGNSGIVPPQPRSQQQQQQQPPHRKLDIKAPSGSLNAAPTPSQQPFNNTFKSSHTSSSGSAGSVLGTSTPFITAAAKSSTAGDAPPPPPAFSATQSFNPTFTSGAPPAFAPTAEQHTGRGAHNNQNVSSNSNNKNNNTSASTDSGGGDGVLSGRTTLPGSRMQSFNSANSSFGSPFGQSAAPVPLGSEFGSQEKGPRSGQAAAPRLTSTPPPVFGSTQSSFNVAATPSGSPPPFSSADSGATGNQPKSSSGGGVFGSASASTAPAHTATLAPAFGASAPTTRAPTSTSPPPPAVSKTFFGGAAAASPTPTFSSKAESGADKGSSSKSVFGTSAAAAAAAAAPQQNVVSSIFAGDHPKPSQAPAAPAASAFLPSASDGKTQQSTSSTASVFGGPAAPTATFGAPPVKSVFGTAPQAATAPAPAFRADTSASGGQGVMRDEGRGSPHFPNNSSSNTSATAPAGDFGHRGRGRGGGGRGGGEAGHDGGRGRGRLDRRRGRSPSPPGSADSSHPATAQHSGQQPPQQQQRHQQHHHQSSSPSHASSFAIPAPRHAQPPPQQVPTTVSRLEKLPVPSLPADEKQWSLAARVCKSFLLQLASSAAMGVGGSSASRETGTAETLEQAFFGVAGREGVSGDFGKTAGEMLAVWQTHVRPILNGGGKTNALPFPGEVWVALFALGTYLNTIVSTLATPNSGGAALASARADLVAYKAGLRAHPAEALTDACHYANELSELLQSVFQRGGEAEAPPYSILPVVLRRVRTVFDEANARGVATVQSNLNAVTSKLFAVLNRRVKASTVQPLGPSTNSSSHAMPPDNRAAPRWLLTYDSKEKESLLHSFAFLVSEMMAVDAPMNEDVELFVAAFHESMPSALAERCMLYYRRACALLRQPLGMAQVQEAAELLAKAMAVLPPDAPPQNKRVLGVKLLTAQLALGRLPSDQDRVALHVPQLIDVVNALKTSRLDLLDAALKHHGPFFVQIGVHNALLLARQRIALLLVVKYYVTHRCENRLSVKDMVHYHRLPYTTSEAGTVWLLPLLVEKAMNGVLDHGFLILSGKTPFDEYPRELLASAADL